MTPEARFWLEAILIFVLLFDGPLLGLWYMFRRFLKNPHNHD